MSANGQPVEVDTRKAIAMLAYLAVEGTVSRDTLAGLFWAESSDERARATLRRTLSALRTGIGGDTIEADRNRIRLVGDVVTDIAGFDQALSATTGHGHDPADVCRSCIPSLAEATSLYRGDFLDGFSVRDAPDFEDWARAVGESYRMRAGEAFHRLAMAYAAAGDYVGAIASVVRWIDLDQIHEPAHRLLMLLNAWAGDRPGAVEAYRSFVAILDHELGVPPLEETTELYEAILDEDLPPAPGLRRRPGAATSPPAHTPTELIDRETELAMMRDFVLTTRDKGDILSVTGPAWMGKTRLLEEIAAEAAPHQVLLGRAFRMEQAIPYGVAAQLLRPLKLPTGPARVPDWAMAELTRLVPGTGSVKADPSDRFGELRLLEAVNEVIAATSATDPLLMIIDDAQWIDPASAALVSYLARRIDRTRVGMIIASRSGEQLPQPIADVVTRAGATVELAPLTADAIVSRVDGREQAEEVVTASGGVPLLVLEMLGGKSGDEGVLRYMRARLGEAGELARQILTTASVLTGLCDAQLIRDVSGRSDMEVVEAVEELMALGLLREIPDTERLGFTLDTLEKVTYDSISPIRRRLLHRRAAEALSSRPRSTTDPRLAAAVAAQYRGAGEPGASEWYRTAGDLAREIYALVEAKTFYQTAIALGNPQIDKIHLNLGEIAMARGEYAEATRELTAAAAQSEGATLGLIEHRMGLVQRFLGRFELALEHFKRAEASHPEPAYLYADWALLLTRVGDTSQARVMGDQAAAAAEATGEDRMISRAFNVLGVVTDDPGDAIENLDRALVYAGDDAELRMAALNNRAHALSKIGNTDAAVRMIEEAVELASSTGHHHREAALLNHLADLHHQAGRTAEAETSLTRAVTLFADIDAGDWQPEVWLLSQW